MEPERKINTALAAGLIVTLLGGAWLFAYTLGVAKDNAEFICSFGTAINSAKTKQRSDESDKDFRKRVRAAREFVRSLNQIQDCDPPAVIRIDRESKPALQRHEGGGSSNPGNTPPSIPDPPPSGGGSDGNGPPADPPGNGTPPTSPPSANPPDKPGLLDPTVDEVENAICDLTDPIVSVPVVCP